MVGERLDRGGEHGQVDRGEVAVGVVELVHGGDAEFVGRRCQFATPCLGKVDGGGAECGSLALGEADEIDRGSLIDEGRDDGAEAEALVVRVGAHGEHPLRCRDEVVGCHVWGPVVMLSGPVAGSWMVRTWNAPSQGTTRRPMSLEGR